MLWNESFNFQAICRALFDALGFALNHEPFPKLHLSSTTFVI
jgi:hypothetical protein